MASPQDTDRRLEALGISPGDEVKVETEGRTFGGILLPHHDFSEPGIVTIKLPSGYNIGVKLHASSRVALVRKSPHGMKGGQGTRHKARRGAGSLEKVAFAGTGGTIASFVDYRTGGVFPAMDAAGIVSLVPEISDICRLEGKTLFSVFSENIGSEEWSVLAGEVADRLNEGYSGVLISHGTDTMSYTAAALSFMLSNLTGTVVLVGAQRSPDRPSFDGYVNLISAARVASQSDIGEVTVVMHASSSDRGCHVHRGTKVRKMHSSRRDAFRSINSDPIAFVDDEIHYLSEYRRRSSGKVSVDTRMEDDVALIQFYPDMKHEDFLAWTRGKKGVVLAGTGLGHASTGIVDAVRRRVDGGVPVVVTTQCLNGSVDMNVYATGRDLIRGGAISGGDMLPETAYVKLRHVLAHSSGMEEVRRAMQKNLAGELNDRRRGGDGF